MVSVAEILWLPIQLLLFVFSPISNVFFFIRDAIEGYHYRNRNESRIAKARPRIHEMFMEHDRDGNGVIDHAEFKTLVVDILRFLDPEFPKTRTLNEEEIEVLRKLVDRNQDEEVTEEELWESLKEWVIVDLQNDFISGSLKVAEAEQAVHATNRLRKRFKFDVIAQTRDWHPAKHCSFASTHKELTLEDSEGRKEVVEQMMWPDHCVSNSHGAKFHSELIVEGSDLIIDKGTKIGVDSYSGFFDNCRQGETSLQKELKRREVGEVYVVGVASDYCVGSTALDAAACGFTTYVVHDCSKPVAEASWESMKTKLREAQVPMPRRWTSENTLEAAKRLVRRAERSPHRVNGGHTPCDVNNLSVRGKST